MNRNKDDPVKEYFRKGSNILKPINNDNFRREREKGELTKKIIENKTMYRIKEISHTGNGARKEHIQ